MAERLVREPAHGMLFIRLVGGSSDAASALGRISGAMSAPRPQPQVLQ
jgi:hypothetical protein